MNDRSVVVGSQDEFLGSILDVIAVDDGTSKQVELKPLLVGDLHHSTEIIWTCCDNHLTGLVGRFGSLKSKPVENLFSNPFLSDKVLLERIWRAEKDEVTDFDSV